MTPFERIQNGEFLTGIVRNGMPQESYGDFWPPLVPVNILGQTAMVDPNNPGEISADRIKIRVEYLHDAWSANGNLLVLNLEQLYDADGKNLVRGRLSQCLERPEVWTEDNLQLALVEARIQVQRTADIFNSVFQVVREEVPEMKIGWWALPYPDPLHTYSVLANRVAKCLPHDAEPQQWFYQCFHWLVEHIRLCGELFDTDWYAPACYLGGYHGLLSHDPPALQWLDDMSSEITPLHAATDSEHDVWRLQMLVGLKLIRSLTPSKPMLPFVALQWWQQGDQDWSHGYGRELVGPKLIVDMLDFVNALDADGVVLWSQHQNFNEDPKKFYHSPTFRSARAWARHRMCMQREANE